MSPDLFTALTANLLSPAVLFFVLGILATLVRSDLKFPEPLYVTLTLYLLVAIGFKGGVAVREAGIERVWLPALTAIVLGALIPLWTYPVLRHLGGLSGVDAAAVSGHYGSVSAMTFIAATQFLNQVGQPFESYASAFLAVMEAPAIIVAVVLGKLALPREARPLAESLRGAVHEAAFGRSVVLLIGSMIIGWASGKRGAAMTEGFFVSPFQGVLALFLLEMGLVAARRFADLRRVGPFLVGFGILAPVVNGSIGAAVGHWVGLGPGGSMLLGVLAGSASYIAAPAAMRLSLPEANPTLYLTASLAVTFPFNLTVGLPLYYVVAKSFAPDSP